MEHIKPTIDKFPVNLEKACDVKESKEDAGIRLASACCVVYLILEHELNIDKNDKKRLFGAILLRSNEAKEHCMDYQELVDVHFQTEKWRR